MGAIGTPIPKVAPTFFRLIMLLRKDDRCLHVAFLYDIA